MSTFSNADKAKEAEREVSMRMVVFSNRVEAGKMKREDAERKIALMQAIAADYRALADEDAKRERLL